MLEVLFSNARSKPTFLKIPVGNKMLLLSFPLFDSALQTSTKMLEVISLYRLYFCSTICHSVRTVNTEMLCFRSQNSVSLLEGYPSDFLCKSNLETMSRGTFKLSFNGLSHSTPTSPIFLNYNMQHRLHPL